MPIVDDYQFRPALVGFAGRAGVGKDTAAQALLPMGFRPMAFADPLKQMLDALLEDTAWDDREWKEALLPRLGVSPRFLAQTLGTEWGRQTIHPDFWVKIARHRLEDQWRVAFTDVRFPNELKMIQDHDGVVIYITRPGAPAVESHSSENSINPQDCDTIVTNTYPTVAEFQGTIRSKIYQLLFGPIRRDT